MHYEKSALRDCKERLACDVPDLLLWGVIPQYVLLDRFASWGGLHVMQSGIFGGINRRGEDFEPMSRLLHPRSHDRRSGLTA